MRFLRYFFYIVDNMLVKKIWQTSCLTVLCLVPTHRVVLAATWRLKVKYYSNVKINASIHSNLYLDLAVFYLYLDRAVFEYNNNVKSVALNLWLLHQKINQAQFETKNYHESIFTPASIASLYKSDLYKTES